MRRIKKLFITLIIMKKAHMKRVLFCFWIITIAIAIYYFRELWIPLNEYPNFIKNTLDMAGPWLPLIYIITYTVRPLVFFPATILTAAAWALFGPWYGILYTIIWENFSANVSFVVWRYFGKDLMQDMVKKSKMLAHMDCKFRDNGFIAVLIMRLIYMPFDLVWYMSWICNLRHIEYAIWTFVWILPWLITFVVLWASFSDPRNLVIAWLFFVAWLVISKYLKKKKVLESRTG